MLPSVDYTLLDLDQKPTALKTDHHSLDQLDQMFTSPKAIVHSGASEIQQVKLEKFSLAVPWSTARHTWIISSLLVMKVNTKMSHKARVAVSTMKHQTRSSIKTYLYEKMMELRSMKMCDIIDIVCYNTV